jgi:hypothetical protein
MKEIFIRGYEKEIYMGFNIVMAIYFMFAFFFPEQSGYWLVTNGFPIILIEFLSFFITIFLFDYWGGEQEVTIKKKCYSLLGLCGILVMAGVAIIVFNPLLFLYLLVSVGIKFFMFKSKGTRLKARIIQVYSALILILTVMIAIVLSNVMLFFTDQIVAYQEFFKTLPGTMSGLIVDNPGFIALWGCFYFVFLSLYEIVVKMRESKKKNIHL